MYNLIIYIDIYNRLSVYFHFSIVSYQYAYTYTYWKTVIHCVELTDQIIKYRLPNIYQHTGDKWLIHGLKHREENQSQSLFHLGRSSLLGLLGIYA